MFKKKLGGIIQVGDTDEDTMDTVAAEEPTMPEVQSAPVSEDVWDSDEEKAAKREVQEQSTVIGKAAVMNAIWRYLPKYAAMAPGLNENSWKNYLSKIETERERVIRMSPEAGDDFLLFLKEQ